MSESLRSFISLTYQNEASLISALRQVESELGKYDFFSHYIQVPRFPGSRLPEGARQKILSMKKKLHYDKVPSFFRKVEKIIKSHESELYILCGYINHSQVVTLSGDAGGEKIFIGSGVYARLEYCYEEGSYHTTPWSFDELKSADARKFFEDLRRIVQSGG